MHRINDKPNKNQIFLPLGKKESYAAEGCMGFFSVLCICMALKSHMYYYLLYKYSKSSSYQIKFIIRGQRGWGRSTHFKITCKSYNFAMHD